MAATKTAQAVEPTRAAIKGTLEAEGLEAHWWGNAPGDKYSWHSHPYHKVLFCRQGSIVFHTRQGDLGLRPGDRLDVEPYTEHAATVGPQGVSCAEGHRR